jgi:hypothetical protein
MADAQAVSQLQAVLGGSCRHFHDLLVRGTLIGWSDVPIALIYDLAATRAQIDAILADLRRYELAAADCKGELATLQPLGLIVMEPVLKEVEALWTSNQYDAAVRMLRSAYATKQNEPRFVQHYLRYCYLLGLRALILGNLAVAYDALQEVVHLTPEHLRAQELLRDIERLLRGEAPAASPAGGRAATSLLPSGSRRALRPIRRRSAFSAVAAYGGILIASFAVLLMLVLLVYRGDRSQRALEPSPVPTTPAATASPQIAVIAPTTAPTRQLEATRSLPSAQATSTSTPAPPTLRPAPTTPPTQPPTPADCGIRRVAVPVLNVRDKPLGRRVHKVSQGAELTLTCETQTVEAQRWVKIRVSADPTIAGWVSANYLEQP